VLGPVGGPPKKLVNGRVGHLAPGFRVRLMSHDGHLGRWVARQEPDVSVAAFVQNSLGHEDVIVPQAFRSFSASAWRGWRQNVVRRFCLAYRLGPLGTIVLSEDCWCFTDRKDQHDESTNDRLSAILCPRLNIGPRSRRRRRRWRRRGCRRRWRRWCGRGSRCRRRWYGRRSGIGRGRRCKWLVGWGSRCRFELGSSRRRRCGLGRPNVTEQEKIDAVQGALWRTCRLKISAGGRWSAIGARRGRACPGRRLSR
jgi:hypothetical protein